MKTRTLRFASAALLLTCFVNLSIAQNSQSEQTKIEEETMRHFQAILRLDTSNPPGNEKLVVDYLKTVLELEGIETKVFALDPQRPNLVARLRGNGKKRPVLIMGHTDVVTVDPSKWKHPPFSATREGGYVFGRGTLDDKHSVAAGLMTMLQLKRTKVALERDVIFLAEASEEGNGPYGINFMVEKHWREIDAEYCLAEGGEVIRSGGKIQYATVVTTEKVAHTVKLIARGVAGHGSVPLRSNPIVHLSQAVAKVSAWQTPMRLNETTRAYLAALTRVSEPEEVSRFQRLLQQKDTDEIQEYLAINKPRLYSTLRTSISPNIIKGGYLRNVIPSEAEATLDIRALPDEDFPALLAQLRKIINDPAIEIVEVNANATRPGASPSRLDTEAFQIIEAAHRRIHNVATLPTMLTGGTDMAQVRARGVQCYGIGPMIDIEDGPKGFGAHSDQERILEEGLHKFVRLQFEVVVSLVKSN